MSVIVKGMEMPKNCGRCPFAGVCGVHSCEEWPDLESIMFNDVIGIDGSRDPDCPLIPVPPHGRLIDADDVDNHIIGHVELRDCPTIIPAEEG